MPTQKEFELFREYFEAQGYPSIIASPDELEFSNGRLRVRDFEVDIVYKRLLVNEYLPIMREHPALLDACRARAVCMVNSFRSKIIHKKALFAVLTDARYASLFNGDELAATRGHVPWTRKVRAGKSDYNGEEIDLLEFIGERRERLVLKPNDDYGGHGIYIGWNTDEIGWDEAIRAGQRRLSGAGARANGTRSISGAYARGHDKFLRAVGRSRSAAFQRKSWLGVYAPVIQ